MTILDDATIEGVKVTERFGDAIQHATINRSIDEAPMLTLAIIDPDLEITNSPLIARLADDDDVIIGRANPRLDMPPVMRVDGNDWVLVRAGKQDQRVVQLVFVLLEVYLLTVTNDYRKAFRDRIDRVTFCESMCREAGVKFHAPEAGPAAPRFAPSTAVPGSTPAAGAASGFEAGVKIFINGAPAHDDQLNSLSIALDEAIRLGASEAVMIGMVMSGTGESNWDRRNLNHVGAGHYGIMQQDPRYYTRPDAFHVLQNIHEFLVGGRSSPGGPGTWDIEHDRPITDKPQPGSFMALMAGFTGRVSTIGDIIKRRQGSDASGAYYQQFYAESKRTVAAYQSPDRKHEHTVLLAKDRYEFTRGQPGNPESTWDCLARLAAEIGWRRFMVSDTVWFVADEWLFATPSLRTLAEASSAPVEAHDYIADQITWSWDRGQPLNELEVSVDDTWVHSPGVVLRVARQGPASGKWLLAGWERDLLEPTGTLRLVKPGQTIPEPVGDQSGKGWKRKPQPPQPAGLPPMQGPVVGNYVTPFASLHGSGPFKFAGVDEGTDWSGAGPIYAIGDALITNATPQDGGTGWPGHGYPALQGTGALICYQLLGGSRQGSYIYLAENVDPVPNLRVGQRVRAGTHIATARGQFPYIETGWAANGHGMTLARAHGDKPTKSPHPTPDGQNFYDFLKSIGAA